MSSTKSFKNTHPFPRRLEESKRVLSKYPDRVPVIMEKANAGKDDIPVLDRVKFLVPLDVSVNQFTYIIRKRIELSSEQALFVMIENSLAPNNKTLSELYDTHKDKDNFLYITYTSENTFG